ncbi:MAG TPA: type II secretion system protein [Methylomirabilota bacterium]|nr:type II secretion system protein [Methylomirabilota bacterium]
MPAYTRPPRPLKPDANGPSTEASQVAAMVALPPAGVKRGPGGTPATLRLRPRAFTLIEMLVVIAVIGILAGIILGVVPGITEKRTRATVEAMLKQLTTAIDVYHAEKGFYPPSDPTKRHNSLFYELTGARTDATDPNNLRFTTDIEPTAMAIPKDVLNTVFGVEGIINARPSGGKNYLPGLRPQSYAKLQGTEPPPRPFVLLVPATGTNEAMLNVWYYDASSPTRHNKNSYDLWAVFKIGNKTNVIGNWKQ